MAVRDCYGLPDGLLVMGRAPWETKSELYEVDRKTLVCGGEDMCFRPRPWPSRRRAQAYYLVGWRCVGSMAIPYTEGL